MYTLEKPKEPHKKRTRTALRRVQSRRHGIRLTRSLLEAIDCHRFLGEADSCLIERLLIRLAKTGIVLRTFHGDSNKAKDHQTGFAATAEIESLIQSHWQGEDFEQPKRGDFSWTVTQLLWTASCLPVVEPLTSADEVLALLKEKFEGRTRSPLVVKLLTERCSYEKAVEWLLELGDRGDLWLISIDHSIYEEEAISLGGRKVGAIAFLAVDQGDRN